MKFNCEKELHYRVKCAILIMKLYRQSITMPFLRGSYVSGNHEHESPERTGYVLRRRVTKIWHAGKRAEELEETR